MSHPKVRSTTQRRGSTLNPCSPSIRRTISMTNSQECGLVHELGAIVGPVSEEMLEPRPALANGIEDRLSPGAVGDIGWGQIKPSASARRCPPPRVACALRSSCRHQSRAWPRAREAFTVCAIENATLRTGLATTAFAIHHQCHVVDGAKQHQPDEAAKPPVDGLPRREILRQHAPAAAGTRHVTDRIQHFPKINRRLASTLGKSGAAKARSVPILHR